MVLAPKLYKFMYDGVDITPYVIKAEGPDEYSTYVPEVIITVSSKIDSIVTIDEQTSITKSVTVQRGVNSPTEYYKFRGEVSSIQYSYATYVLKCKNKYVKAQRVLATKSYDINIDSEAGVISEIAKDLITVDAGLPISPTSVQDSGTAFVLDKFVCNNSGVYERIDALRGALNWQTYFNSYDDYVYFEPKGFVDSGITLTVGENVLNNPSWDSKTDRLCNSAVFVGAVQYVQTTEYFNGTNADGQEFQLRFTPTDMKVYVGSGSFNPSAGTKPSNSETNLRKGGSKNSTSGTYDYVYDPDTNVRKVIFRNTAKGAQPSYTPPVGTNNIEVQYSYELPTPIYYSDQDSIDKYGYWEKPVTRSDIKTVDDAEVYVYNYVEALKNPLLSTALVVTGLDDIRVGRQYRVVDSTNGIDKNFLVTKTKWFYPYKPDEIDVGEDPMFMFDMNTLMLDRIKKLEESQSNTQDLLVSLSQKNGTFRLENREYELYRKNVAGTSRWDLSNWDSANWNETETNGFILGSATQGVLGSNTLGDPGTQEILIHRIPGDGVFKEYVYDTYYYDAVNSVNIAFDTAQKKIRVGEYSKLQSTVVSKGVAWQFVTVSANVTGQIHPKFWILQNNVLSLDLTENP